MTSLRCATRRQANSLLFGGEIHHKWNLDSGSGCSGHRTSSLWIRRRQTLVSQEAKAASKACIGSLKRYAQRRPSGIRHPTCMNTHHMCTLHIHTILRQAEKKVLITGHSHKNRSNTSHWHPLSSNAEEVDVQVIEQGRYGFADDKR